MQSILDLYQADGHQARKVASTSGGEYAGRCPACGGTDRFRIWPGAGRWWCRQCGKRGDLPGYLMEFHGLSYPEACARLGQEPRQGVKSARQAVQDWLPMNPANPPNAWQERATACVQWAEKTLAGPQGEAARDFLMGRGLSMTTIRDAHLGVILADLWLDRAAWGLPEQTRPDGQPKRLWIPAGLVIPTYRDGAVVGIKVRRWEGEPRYYRLPGGGSFPYLAGCGADALVIESELDALLVGQHAGDLVTSVALGSASNRPDAQTHKLLSAAPQVLVALDSDQAGAKQAFGWWLPTYRNAKRWPVPNGKDPTELHIAGGSLRVWILAAKLPTSKAEKDVDCGFRPGDPIPRLTERETAEINAWPAETQSIWSGMVERFEGKGYSQAEAESLAWAATRKLVQRMRSRRLCLVSDLPPELVEAVGLTRDVFPGSEIDHVELFG